MSFRVTNNTDQEREFISEVKLPEGWTLITKDYPFELEPQEYDIRLLSFFVPQTALAGKYRITYFVRDKAVPSLTGFYPIFVQVVPLIKIKAELLQAPKYVIAGDSYQVIFVITNESNIETTIRTIANSSGNFPFNMDPNDFKLQPGESKKLNLMVETDENIQKEFKEVIQISAEVIEHIRPEDLSGEEELTEWSKTAVKHEKFKAHAIATIDIIPRISIVEDRYHEIPGEITFKWAIEKEKYEKSGFQTKISGKGKLDEEGKRDLEFLFKVSDNDYESIYSSYDELFLGYKDESHKLQLGDLAYFLSSLTENYLYGRGIEGEKVFDNFYIKAYHMKTQRFRPGETQTGVHVNYLMNDKHKIAFNYLNKRVDNEENKGIASLSGTVKPIKDTEISMEFSNSNKNKDNAFMLSTSGNKDNVFYYLKYIHADPDFPGYYTDMDFISSSLIVFLTDRLGLETYFRQERNNISLNTQKGSSFVNKFYGLGCNYHLKTGTYLSFDLRSQSRVDRVPNSTIDYKEDSFRFSIGHNLKKVNLYSAVELSQIGDRLTNRTVGSEYYMLNALFRPMNKVNCKGYLYWKNNGDVNGITKHNLATGLGISYKVLERTLFHFNFKNDQYKKSVQNRSFFETELNHRLLNNHTISVFGRHFSYKDPLRRDETVFMIQYSIPFGMPVHRKKGIGGIRGKVYDIETQEPLSNVILRLNGLSAVTDKSGNFIFPSVYPGTFYLSVDRSQIDPDKMPIKKTPIEVTVKGGTDSFVEIPVGQSASFNGQVVIYQPENGGYFFDANQKLVKKGGLENLILEMTNGKEITRRITDNKGYFNFRELQPGKWTLKVYKNNIPEYHSLERDTFEFELKPGEEQSILINVLPKKRHIYFLKTDEMLIGDY